MKQKTLFFSLFVFLFTASIFSQPITITYQYDPRGIPKDKIIEITHLTAHLKIEPFTPSVEATAEFDFFPYSAKTDSFSFQTTDFDISKITLDGKEVDFKRKGNKTWIYPSWELTQKENHKIVFEYKVNPKYEFYTSGWNDPRGIKRKQIWAHRPHGYLPYLPGRITVDMFITFDDDYQVYSNGTRVNVEQNDDGTKTWHYRMKKNHPFFSTALVIGKYKYKSFETKRGLPLEYWYYPDREDFFDATYQYSAEMFDFLEEEIGYNYPYELYRNCPVVDYLYGAMETTTSTIYGDYMHIDPRAYWMRNYINVNAHELTHQWFGNCISHKTNNIWLTEGFATYFAKIFERSIFGDDYYQNWRNKERTAAFEAAKKNNNPVGQMSAGSKRWYQKGSLILDMLRYVLGDDDFKSSIKYYTEHFAFKEAEIHDLENSIYAATGKSLHWFFDEWLYRGGEPEYEISYKSLTDEAGETATHVYIKQIHKMNELVKTFKMPIVIDVYYKDGTKSSGKFMIEDKFYEAIIPNQNKHAIDFVIFDPNREVLKKVKFNRTFEELSAQALKAENMIDRYDALLELRNFKLDKKRSVLASAYGNESFHLTKGEIISQLSGDSSKEALDIFISAIKDEDALVRNALLQNVRAVPLQIRNEYETLLKDYSYANIELALRNLCASFPEETQKYLESTKEEIGWRGKNIRIAWLEIAIDAGAKEYLTELTDYASGSYDFEARMNSIAALQRLNILNDDILKNIVDSYLYWNYKLRNRAAEALKYFYKQNDYAKMINNYISSGALNKQEKEKLLNLLK
ncbi:MAG: M1 family metallopeptidase [Chlorobi bacterium]|nr:M1 family metallopeptidase [Chlorobiota bacterium]